MLVELAAVIHDPVTTTDELIPSGETSSYRSNPLKLSEFALSQSARVRRQKQGDTEPRERARREGNFEKKLLDALAKVDDNPSETIKKTSFGSCVFANRPGDGSAREQAASCQKVLGGDANICYEYATKRYRSNCINWGIVPLRWTRTQNSTISRVISCLSRAYATLLSTAGETIPAKVITQKGVEDITLYVKGLTADEKTIICEGCLMNYYAALNRKNK